MKSALVYASRCLQHMEEHWIPYSALWWRFWTPSIGRGERYQEGYFDGYPTDDDEDMPALDIRRVLAIPFVRRFCRKLPFIDVVPVKRPWEDMSAEQRRRRDEFVVESTLAAYNAGKALYRRDTIRQIEDQLQAAAERRLRGRRERRKARLRGRGGGGDHGRQGEDGEGEGEEGDSSMRERRRNRKKSVRQRLLSGCEAPQTAWVRFTDYDGVVQHVATWAPGAEVLQSDGVLVYRPGRSQVEFRSIQELTMPDPDNTAEQFAPDSWLPSVAYSPVTVRRRPSQPDHLGSYPGAEDLRTPDQLVYRLLENRWAIAESAEWRAFERAVRSAPTGRALRSVDKIVFFYALGMTDGSAHCRRAMSLFAVVTRLQELVRELKLEADRGACGAPLLPPIYMPAYDIRRTWNYRERALLRWSGVVLVESNGELFLGVDERTAVVSYRSWNPVKQVVADMARPAVLICRAVSGEDAAEGDFRWVEEDRDGETVRVPAVRARHVDDSGLRNDPDSPRVRSMVADYDRFALPELPAQTPEQEIMSVYVRRPEASTKVDYW